MQQEGRNSSNLPTLFSPVEIKETTVSTLERIALIKLNSSSLLEMWESIFAQKELVGTYSYQAFRRAQF